MLSRRTLCAEHEELRTLAQALLACVARPAVDEAQLGQIRWSLTRKLLAHLAKEDALLYPRLRAGPDARLAAVAARFANEMGPLADRYRAYITEWPADRIIRDWPAFGQATRQMMHLMLQRMEGEDKQLYAMIEDSPARRTHAA